MKTIAIIVSVIHVSLGLSHLLLGTSQKQAAPKAASKDAYQGLRNSAPQSSRAKLGLPPTQTKCEAFSRTTPVSVSSPTQH
jgi:hypothetical protein